MTEIISVITARSGSKRLPNKNIKNICSKPLIYYTIKASQGSSLISETYVDTDGEKIARISKKLGATVPFLRKKKFSHSKSSSISTVCNFLKNLPVEKKKNLKLIVLLQPTSPLRTKKHLSDAIKLFLKSKKFTSLVSVVKKPTMFLKKNTLFSNNNFFFFRPKCKEENSIYSANGAIYIFRYKNMFAKNPYGKNIKIFKMKLSESVDIDYIDDFKIAKKLLD